MTIRTHYLAAAAAIGALAVPAAAQTAYPGYQYPQYQQSVPQPYPGQPGYAYGQQGYSAYGQQGYAQNPVAQIIDSLLGNRYNVTDRAAVSQCATAAMAQATAQYGGGYNRGYSNLRVTSVSDVQRRNNGLRVSGMMSSGYGGQYGTQYGNQYGNQNAGYGQQLSFRCNVDYRGAVTNIRIKRAQAYGR
jgi:hypothetical protein